MAMAMTTSIKLMPEVFAGSVGDCFINNFQSLAGHRGLVFYLQARWIAPSQSTKWVAISRASLNRMIVQGLQCLGILHRIGIQISLSVRWEKFQHSIALPHSLAVEQFPLLPHLLRFFQGGVVVVRYQWRCLDRRVRGFSLERGGR